MAESQSETRATASGKGVRRAESASSAASLRHSKDRSSGLFSRQRNVEDRLGWVGWWVGYDVVRLGGSGGGWGWRRWGWSWGVRLSGTCSRPRMPRQWTRGALLGAGRPRLRRGAHGRRARLARPGHRNARPTIRPRQGGCGKYPPSLPRVTLMHCPP